MEVGWIIAAIKMIITIVWVVSATTAFQSTRRLPSITLPHPYVGRKYRYNTRYALVFYVYPHKLERLFYPGFTVPFFGQ